MDFILTEVGVPIRCSRCDGAGRTQWNSCWTCGGHGYLIKCLLTYNESYDTGGNPCGRQMFSGYIERPYSRAGD